MSRGEADLVSGSWNGMLPNANGMPFLSGLFGANGAPDPAALAAAYAQLQQQQNCMVQGGQGRGRYNGRAAYPPDRSGVKKCGHCQSTKPCVEFSADTSRGDGLRGWCKMCEAEARSTRYKKRKAAAQQAAAARRRFEMPLGGVFWGNQGGEEGASPPQFGSQPPNMDPQAMQHLLAILAFQQQQQQQHMAAAGQNGGGSGHSHGQQGMQQHGGSALHAVGRGSARDVRAAAFAAANGNGNGATKSSGSPTGGSGSSPVTSDSENSAMERFKKQRLGRSPAGEAAAAWAAANPGAAAAAAQMQQLQQQLAAAQQAVGGQQMRRGSQDTDDSAAAMALAFGPAAAGVRLPLSAAQHAALAHVLPPGAPLPPTEIHVPKRKRTCTALPALEPPVPAPAQPGPAANGRPTVPKSTKYREMGDLAAAPQEVAPKPESAPKDAASEVVQWGSRMMTTLLLARAAGYVGRPLIVVPQQPPPAAAQGLAAAVKGDAPAKFGATAPVAEPAASLQLVEAAAPAKEEAVPGAPESAAAPAAAAAEAANGSTPGAERSTI